MVQQPAEARSLNGVEAPQLSRDAVHEPFMFVLKTKILQDFDRRCLKAGLLMKKAFARPVARGCKVEVKVLTRRMETANKGRDEEVPSQWCYAHRPQG